MKSAFAKLLEKNPTQSSEIAFRAGGNGVPILTRASGCSVNGVQNMGLPGGNMPTPGGGNNKTTLGIYRMGESDGNGGPSAIIGNPGDIFPPNPPIERMYPERTFANVGNNVYQPHNNDVATHALLRRLGDQQFKAVANAPFEDYRAQQRLARDLDEASRNASLSDLGTSREIIRNLAAERRQQNEDDYMRKMLDAGATPEAARKEIEDVRNAKAIQEAKKVEDRSYQAKTLISRIAMARGVTPMVREPLNHSSSIDNPQRSQAMSQAMGMPGEGFGTSPLDMNRQFMTPDFYKKFLRKSNISQEASDEATAFSQLITGSGAQDAIPPPSSGSFSMATLRGQERQNQIELAAEGLASRLETLRARGERIIKPIPANVVGKKELDALYERKKKKAGNKVLYSLETIQDMSNLQLLIALNIATIIRRDGIAELKRLLLEAGVLGVGEVPASDLTTKLKGIVQAMNGNEPNIEIPFRSDTTALPNARLLTILNDIKTSNSETLAREARTAGEVYLREINADDIPFAEGPTMVLAPEETATTARDEFPIPGAPGPRRRNPVPSAPRGLAPNKGRVRRGPGIREQADKALAGTKISTALGKQFRKKAVKGVMSQMLDQTEFDAIDSLTVDGLKTELRAAGLSTTGNKPELRERLKAQFNTE
jgi:hypothetical protein